MELMNPIKLSTFKALLVTVLVFCTSTSGVLTAQEDSFKEIITPFKEYSTAFRELSYCHLNKSTYIKGEMVGFSAYVLDKGLKTPSELTKNLYCIITDNNDKLIKSKLVKVENGFANNIFKIDSVFTSGNYKFKAYTN